MDIVARYDGNTYDSKYLENVREKLCSNKECIGIHYWKETVTTLTLVK